MGGWGWTRELDLFFLGRTEKEIEEENREMKDTNIISTSQRERERERSIAALKSKNQIDDDHYESKEIRCIHLWRASRSTGDKQSETREGGVVETRAMKSCPLLVAMKLDL